MVGNGGFVLAGALHGRAHGNWACYFGLYQHFLNGCIDIRKVVEPIEVRVQ